MRVIEVDGSAGLLCDLDVLHHFAALFIDHAETQEARHFVLLVAALDGGCRRRGAIRFYQDDQPSGALH